MLLFLSKQKDKPFNLAKRKFNSGIKETVKNDNSELKNFSTILKFGSGGLGSIVLTCMIKCHTSAVEGKTLKISENITKDNKELTLKWRKFLEYLYPYFWQLLIALSVSIYVQYICICGFYISVYLCNC